MMKTGAAKGSWLPCRTLLQNKQATKWGRIQESRFHSTGTGTATTPVPAFILSFILIAVDDDRDNDDDGAWSRCPVCLVVCLSWLPISVYLFLDRICVWTSEWRLILISIWHSSLTAGRSLTPASGSFFSCCLCCCCLMSHRPTGIANVPVCK